MFLGIHITLCYLLNKTIIIISVILRLRLLHLRLLHHFFLHTSKYIYKSVRYLTYSFIKHILSFWEEIFCYTG